MAWVLGVGGLLACGGDVSEQSEAFEPGPAPAESSIAPAPEELERTLVVFLGDSLTAGLGLDAEQAFPHLVEETLLAEGFEVRVVNAGVSGDTVAGGRSRLGWLLHQEPDVLVVGLGANDGLRGLDLQASEEHLRAIVKDGQAAGVEILLLGMLIPPNYGQDYSEAFASMYPRIAEETGVPLVPFMLEGVAGDPEFNLPDGVHPNAEGQEIIAETVLEHLKPML
ncbi:MAG: arylesterase [Thermoanaerobaculia bacterium]|nr:arylesterase [Thermoanaerobaculia bacterium]